MSVFRDVRVYVAVLLMAVVWRALLVLSPGPGLYRHGVVDVSIGFHPRLKEADRAAMATLAREISRRPHARVFVVRWVQRWQAAFETERWQSIVQDTSEVRYERASRSLQEGAGSCLGVTDRMIRDVARRGRGVGALADYGCPEGP